MFLLFKGNGNWMKYKIRTWQQVLLLRHFCSLAQFVLLLQAYLNARVEFSPGCRSLAHFCMPMIMFIFLLVICTSNVLARLLGLLLRNTGWFRGATHAKRCIPGNIRHLKESFTENFWSFVLSKVYWERYQRCLHVLFLAFHHLTVLRMNFWRANFWQQIAHFSPATGKMFVIGDFSGTKLVTEKNSSKEVRINRNNLTNFWLLVKQQRIGHKNGRVHINVPHHRTAAKRSVYAAVFFMFYFHSLLH